MPWTETRPRTIRAVRCWTLTFALLWLTGCASTMESVVLPPATPPASLLTHPPLPPPPRVGERGAALLDYIAALRQALEEYAGQIDGIAAWAARLTSEDE